MTGVVSRRKPCKFLKTFSEEKVELFCAKLAEIMLISFFARAQL